MSKEEKKVLQEAQGPRALRDFHIFHPPHADIRIKAGDDLSKVPALYHQNLVTEGVMAPQSKGL